MEEELNLLKKMGSEKFLMLAANGGLTDLIEENISRHFQAEDPLGFFQKYYDSKVHSVLINWMGWRSHHCQNLYDLLQLLKITYQNTNYNIQITHLFCNRIDRSVESEYVVDLNPNKADSDELRKLYVQYQTHEVNYLVTVNLNNQSYDYCLDIWNSISPKEQVVELLNFINHTLSKNDHAKKWFLGFSFCTIEQYRFIQENRLINSMYVKDYTGLKSMNLLNE